MLLPRSRICHALNGNGVTQLAAKYGLEKARAQRDVDALMKAPTTKPWLSGRLRFAAWAREILRNGHF
jgi:hypothetical protein